MNALESRIAGGARASYSQPRLALILTLGLGIVVTILLSAIVLDREQALTQSEFAHWAHLHTAVLQAQIHHYGDIVDSLGGLFTAASVERQDFRAFAQEQLAHHGGIQALGWVPRVLDAERVAVEARARDEGLAGFAFTEPGVQGGRQQAARRTEYFPVYFVEPLTDNASIAGWDLASDPRIRPALEQARDSGKTVFFTPLALEQAQGAPHSSWILGPVYRQGVSSRTVAERRAHLLGFAVGVFHAGALVEAALQGLPSIGLDLALVDETAPETQWLYVRPSPTRKANEPITTARSVSAWSSRVLLIVPGQHWSALFAPAPQFLATHRPQWTLGVLLGGLLLTGLLGLYFHSRAKRIAELVQARHEWSNAFDSIRDAIFLHDRAGRILRANRAYLQLAGRAMDEVIGRPYWEVFPQASGPLPSCQQALQDWAVHQEEIAQENGKVFRARAFAASDERGGYRCSVHLLEDITEPKQAEQALRELAAQLAESQRLAHLGSWDWNIARDEVRWSDELFQIMGHTPQASPMNMEQALSTVHPEDRARVVQKLERSVRTKQPFFDEHRVVRPDGSVWVIESRAEVLCDAQENPFRLVGTLQNINERKQAEDELRRLNRELQRTLAELRATQQQVIRSEKLSALGTLAAGVAHELNNPMMGVLNYVEYAHSAVQDPKVKKMLANADRELQRMRDLLKNMLMFARPITEPLSEVNVGPVLDHALQLLEPEFRARQITMIKEVPESLSRVLAKEGHLQQVFVNLLMNARDALQQSAEKTVRLRAYEDGGSVCVEVRDTGVGIPVEIQGRIFDPFFTTKPPGQGTGLGLSMSQNIVADLSGTLRVESRPGAGATFTVALPKHSPQQILPPVRLKGGMKHVAHSGD